MTRNSRVLPGAETRAGSTNLLWIITAVIAIFFCGVAAILIAWG